MDILSALLSTPPPMSSAFTVSHTFHPVGQGLFCVGELRRVLPATKNESCLVWVHDCGSDNILERNREIDLARKTLISRNQIDLLILSHLDRDHVDGLDRLLNGVTVKKVVLPYVAPATRLLYALASPGRLTQKYVRFLTEPADYLRNAAEHIEEIIYLDGDGLEEDFNFPNPEVGPTDGDFRLTIEGKEAHKQSTRPPNRADRHMIGPLKIGLHGVWEFLFFNRNTTGWRGNLEKLLPQVEVILTKFDQSVNGAWQTLIEQLKKLYRSKDQFKNDGVGHNDISLLTYAGAVGRHRVNYKKLGVYPAKLIPCGTASPSQACCWLLDINDERQLSFLYTGDITFNEVLANSLQKRLAAYNRWRRVLQFQAPHHGANASWKPPISTVWPQIVSIFSYGVDNSHGHPGQVQWQSLSAHGPTLVNEHIGFHSWALVEWL